jgi:hypothetical protein
MDSCPREEGRWQICEIIIEEVSKKTTFCMM